MNIKLRYEPRKDSINNTDIAVTANDAPIGYLTSAKVNPDILTWSPSDDIYDVAFQFRNSDTFLYVVHTLKEYCATHGYKYLAIWNYNNGYAAQLDDQLLSQAGFRHLAHLHPDCMVL